MKTLNLIRSAAITLLLFATTSVLADEPAKLSPADREAVLAKLKANQVALGSLTIEPKDGGPLIGLGPDGAGGSNVSDENLRLIAQLPEVERVSIFSGKFTADGLSALAGMPKLRRLEIYKPDVSVGTFAALAKLPQLEYLSLGEYTVTDEILGYAGQIKGLKSFDHTKSAITAAGFLKLVNSVESLERLTLFGDFVDDACMKRLGTMTGMKRFWTDSKRITSAGWVHLAGMTQMEDLLLSKTNFGDEDARALEKMTKLRDLGLDGTKVTDKGMGALKGMTELQNLYVGRTEVTAKGLAMVPKKDRMVMMRTGKERLTAKQIDELMQMYPGTQIFDPIGYWKPERIKAAMKELGKDVN